MNILWKQNHFSPLAYAALTSSSSIDAPPPSQTTLATEIRKPMTIHGMCFCPQHSCKCLVQGFQWRLYPLRNNTPHPSRFTNSFPIRKEHKFLHLCFNPTFYVHLRSVSGTNRPMYRRLKDVEEEVKDLLKRQYWERRRRRL